MTEEIYGLTDMGELINNETGRVYCVKGICALALQDELNTLIKENKELKEKIEYGQCHMCGARLKYGGIEMNKELFE